MFFFEAKRFIIVILGALLNAMALNFFLIQANVYASGFTGIAQLSASFAQDFMGVNISTGVLLALLNIPVIILGWFKVGKGFTIYSIISVAFTTIFLETIPFVKFSEEILLNAVFGGLLSGIGVGISLKWGASTGGMDIIAMILSRIKDRPIGIYFLVMNAMIIFFAGWLYDPEKALFTLVTLYVTTRVIDALHTRHNKLTAMIVSTKGDSLTKSIHSRMVRGITRIPAKGAFTGEDREMLFMVITRYELYDLEQIVKDTDPNAFVNIVQTTGVFGFFRKDED
ncbi:MULTISPECIES: YitT family protein [Allobacillus]|uniref:YitT family protein n=1 Tax=Allobacillus halotolerans TaxID=570278 RepID=A0ABS6GU59_9BACI|nr:MULTISPECIES: YitT family protein [Allobacillus]MBU6081787.1 YitT family protein [Allobacillus halotolerans]TSJ62470.1 YitT family protein [Allobacillus sp. SKP2-8]